MVLTSRLVLNLYLYGDEDIQRDQHGPSNTLRFRKGDVSDLDSTTDVEDDATQFTSGISRMTAWVVDAIDEFQSEGRHFVKEHDEDDSVAFDERERW